MPITGPLLRAARALVECSREQVAAESGVSVDTIRQFELGLDDPGAAVRDRLQAALERSGAVFIPENGAGVGVQLKFRRQDVKQIRRMENEGGPVGDDDV